MFKLRRAQGFGDSSLLSSNLYDQNSFYEAFARDIRQAKTEVIIESPFISSKRMAVLAPELNRLRRRGIKVIINTKPPHEHEPAFQLQAEQGIEFMQGIGALVLFTVGHHRKLAIIDRHIAWEGSLNILSQNDSCEFMRRIHSEQLTNQLISFMKIERFIS